MAGAQPPGLAVVVSGEGRPDGRRPGAVAVREFGAGGPTLAGRLLAALDRWIAAGRPGAAEWQIAAVPAGAMSEAPPGVGVVRKKHCSLLVDLPVPSPN
jgi:protein-L-isoaspartate(D-aspartate) O-methyltransferase